MTRKHSYTPFLVMALGLSLTSCGMMRDLFPDRKEDYKETREIPSLEVPPDLSNATVTTDQVPVRRRVAVDDGFDSPYGPKPAPAEVYQAPAPTAAQPVMQSVPEQPAVQAQPVVTMTAEEYVAKYVEPIPELEPEVTTEAYTLLSDQQPPAIQTADAPSAAWEKLDLAIAQAGYQIVKRDSAQGAFYIQTDAVPVMEAEKKSGGLLSKLAFWRDDEPQQADPDVQQVTVPTGDPEMVIRVIPQSSGSRIEVQDLAGKPLSGSAIVTLLGDIHWQLQ